MCVFSCSYLSNYSINSINSFFPGNMEEYLLENVINKNIIKPMQLPFKFHDVNLLLFNLSTT